MSVFHKGAILAIFCHNKFDLKCFQCAKYEEKYKTQNMLGWAGLGGGQGQWNILAPVNLCFYNMHANCRIVKKNDSLVVR